MRPSYMYLKKHGSKKVRGQEGYNFAYDRSQLKYIKN